MIPSISSLEIINVVPDPQIFFWIAGYNADIDVVNPNGTKALLANSVSTFFVIDTAICVNGASKLNYLSSWL